MPEVHKGLEIKEIIPGGIIYGVFDYEDTEKIRVLMRAGNDKRPQNRKNKTGVKKAKW